MQREFASSYRVVLQTIHTARAVEGNIVPNDDTQSHARPQQPSLFVWNQSFIQGIEKCDEAFCTVWAGSWYVAKDTVIGDGSTHVWNQIRIINIFLDSTLSYHTKQLRANRIISLMNLPCSHRIIEHEAEGAHHILIYVDEVKLSKVRRHRRNMIGQRATVTVPGQRGVNITMCMESNKGQKYFELVKWFGNV